MTSARRRVNSTGRRRVDRKCVDIRILQSEPGTALRASITLNLDGQGFPHDALVAVEAYHRSSGMRFEFGTIGNLQSQKDIELSDIDKGGAVLFRLKIVDNNVDSGKLLGSAERITPRSEAEGSNRRFLFPTQYQDLGSDVWKVVIEDEDRPRLLINSKLQDFRHSLQKNPIVYGIILPAAFRFVLQELASDSGDGEEDIGRGWKDEWLEYCREALHIQDSPRDTMSENDKKDWIDKAATRFCEKFDIVKKINAATENV